MLPYPDSKASSLIKNNKNNNNQTGPQGSAGAIQPLCPSLLCPRPRRPFMYSAAGCILVWGTEEDLYAHGHHAAALDPSKKPFSPAGKSLGKCLGVGSLRASQMLIRARGAGHAQVMPLGWMWPRGAQHHGLGEPGRGFLPRAPGCAGLAKYVCHMPLRGAVWTASFERGCHLT